MEQRFQFRHVNELTGLLVLAVLALVVAGIFLSEHSQRWFSRQYSFSVLLPEEGALGLRRGDDVVILGVSVGLVDEISVDDDGRMTASVKIRRDFERFVRADSTATIKKVFGVAGDSLLEISRGHGAPLPLRKPVILCLVSEDSLSRMEKMVAGLHAELMPVVKKVGDGLDQWTKLGAEWRKRGDQWRGFIERLDYLAEGVESGQGTFGKLMTDDSLAESAQELLARANEAMSGLQTVVTNLDISVKNVEICTARLPEITDSAAIAAKDLPGLVQQTQTSMRELERLIEALQKNWLVRKHINPTNPPPMKATQLR
jgi:phospholipid/cholesterol/gamma-HCH transport system substrate-binding protein